MALQPAAPLRRDVERIDEPREQAKIADLDGEIFKTRRAHAFHGKRQNFAIRDFTVFHAEAFGPGLQEWAGAVGFVGLKAERRAMISEPRRKFTAPVEIHAA